MGRKSGEVLFSPATRSRMHSLHVWVSNRRGLLGASAVFIMIGAIAAVCKGRRGGGGGLSMMAKSVPHVKVGEFKGVPWRTKQTLSVTPVLETAFGVCEIHKIEAESGEVIDDWLWFDEYEQVNVLVRRHDGKFVVFRQKKYGFEGQSLAPMGGLVNAAEDPLAAAKRELNEEAGLVSEHWVELGRYRVSSVRGGGHINVFFADRCTPIATKSDRLTGDDMERQEQVVLTQDELRRAMFAQEFKEAKWTQTVAMTLLWLSHHPSSNETMVPRAAAWLGR